MSNYVGVRCPVCQNKFTSTDDIVVCPQCGAPHHRECYAKLGECAFAADHITGKEWRPSMDGYSSFQEEQANAQEQQVRMCPRCNSANPEDAIFCQVCGGRLGTNPGGPDINDFYRMMQANPYGGVRGDDTIAEIPVREMAQYIGPNASYYLPRFMAFDKAGRHILPNISAFLFSFYYCFYRKMYAVGTVLLAVYLAGIVPLFLVAREVGMETMLALVYGSARQVYGPQVGMYLNIFNVMGTINTVLRFALFLLANHLYYNHVVDKIHALRNQAGVNYQQALQTSGGVNQKGTILLMVGIFLFLVVIFSLLMF